MAVFFSNIVSGISKRVTKCFSSKNKKANLNWFKIKYLKHLPYNKPGVFNLNGTKIHFIHGPELFHCLHEIFVEDIYNIEFKKPNPIILDCGANIGLATIYLKQRYPDAKIIAFEPDENNFKLLEKNINQHQWSNIEIRKEAIWKDDCILKFTCDGSLGSKINSESKSANEIEVKAIRLKNLLNNPIDFLKIDIEGAEYEVLKDCSESLDKIDNLFIEFHGNFNKIHELNTIFEIIKNAGFAYYIKEASNVYPTPFNRPPVAMVYDLQLNIFCFRIKNI